MDNIKANTYFKPNTNAEDNTIIKAIINAKVIDNTETIIKDKPINKT